MQGEIPVTQTVDRLISVNKKSRLKTTLLKTGFSVNSFYQQITPYNI